MHAFLKTLWQARPYKLAQAPPHKPVDNIHACKHTANTHACTSRPPVTCAHGFEKKRKKGKKGPQMRAQTAHTGLFFPSQLCSDIKQSPLRENKHADEERLAGHTVLRCLRTHAGTTCTHACVRRVCLEVNAIGSSATNRREANATRPHTTSITGKKCCGWNTN